MAKIKIPKKLKSKLLFFIVLTITIIVAISLSVSVFLFKQFTDSEAERLAVNGMGGLSSWIKKRL